jgi:hypothetical protein
MKSRVACASHDLAHHARVVGAGAGLVVVESGIESGQVQLMVDQVIQRELERAGLDLLAAASPG